MYMTTGKLKRGFRKISKFLICRAKSTGKSLMGKSGQGIAG
jgi:hypothetical protein